MSISTRQDERYPTRIESDLDQPLRRQAAVQLRRTLMNPAAELGLAPLDHRCIPSLMTTGYEDRRPLPGDERRLDVFLRGSRTYVQGSQLLGRTAEWLIELGHSQAVLSHSKFTTITDHIVQAQLKPEVSGAGSSKSRVGEAMYFSGGREIKVEFFDRADARAPRRADEPSRRTDFIDRGEGRGEAQVEVNGTHESTIAAVIETVKALHSSLGPKVEDIWFTSLAGAALPLMPRPPFVARVIVMPLFARRQGGRLQTLSQIEIRDGTAEFVVAPFNIGFSCRLDGG